MVAKITAGCPSPTTISSATAFDRDCIAPAIRELVALKFIEITKPGRAGNAEFRAPNLFRLTYRHTKREEPSHDWRRIATTEQATKLARQARRIVTKHHRTPVAVSGLSSGGNRHQNHSPETATTGHSPETATTLDISGWVLPGGDSVSERAPIDLPPWKKWRAAAPMWRAAQPRRRRC